jgi:hypothetical protein
MNSNDTRGRRQGRGGRRPSYRDHRRGDREPRAPREEAPKKLTFWGRILAFFTGGPKKQTSAARPGPRDSRDSRSSEPRDTEPRATRRPGPPQPVEVTTPKLYIGNLSYEATESDLFNLFKGVGQVQNAEIVTHKGTYKSKGFGFVTMLTVDEARRAVQELHDKEFMGRKLVVNGSKSEGPRE